MVWLRTAGVALLDRAGNFFANRSGPTTVGILPGQTILFAWSAYNALGVLIRTVAIALLKCIFVLCFHVATANIDSVQLIASDASVEEFLTASLGIKRPFGTPLHDWHRERPIFIADEEEGAVPFSRIHGDTLLFSSLCCEVRSSPPVLWVFTGKNDVLAIRTENFLERALVKLLGRRD